MEKEIQEFLNQYDYDIRKSHNGRWIDQKCTMDVLSMVSDCILEYLGDDIEKEFTTRDIWYSEYTIENVQSIFNKPSPKNKAKNEYNKWFGQPLKLLGYSKVLTEVKRKNKNVYKVNNIKILKYIASRDRFAHRFLVIYIIKVLKDSGLYDSFREFFKHQDKEYYTMLRENFFSFVKNNTRINGNLECGRIFTKVLNPLAFELKKKGTVRGKISKFNITLDMLMYNRTNWRDEYEDKPKEITRKENKRSNPNIDENNMSNYKINKAKKQLKRYNIAYRNGLSEVNDGIDNGEVATHMHHIFTVAEFPIIAYYVENIIALTPTQHFNYAHVNGNTNLINYKYQRLCLIAKIGMIKENLLNDNLPKIYSFEDLCYVLNVGFKTNKFENIEYLDFNSLLTHLDFMYSDDYNEVKR